ncbi:MAG: diguanylate cyclase, partial [Actinomycetota bacterium]|nr:diguanylate cyclase [Actinomycetota bacterium]
VETGARAAATAAAADLVQRCRTVGAAARTLALEASARAPSGALAAVVPAYGDYAAVLGRGDVVLAESGRLPAGATSAADLRGCSAGEITRGVVAERVPVSGGEGTITRAVVADSVTPGDLARLASSYAGEGTTLAVVRGSNVLVSSGGAQDAVREAARLAGTPESVRRLDVDGSVAVVAPAGAGLPWSTLAMHPVTGTRSMPAVVGVVSLVAALLGLCLALLVARALTGPLSRLTDEAERVAAGDYERRLPAPKESDEVARLTSSFGQVTSELRAHMVALQRSRDAMHESLRRMGDALGRTHDLPGLVEVVVDTAVVSAGARGGLAMLVDGQSLALVRQQGLTESTVPVPVPERLRIGEGILGRVAATKRPVRGAIGSGPSELAPGPGEPASGEVLAVPMCRGDRLIGVLAVMAAYGSPPFTEEQQAALATLAGQAGIAIDNVRVHAEAERLSLTDPMTGLRNFRYLSMELAREIERASRFRRPLSVLMLDLDHFKSVNDTYGHARGDAVLRELAVRLSEVKREVDTLARYGGEEFALVLPETGSEGATMLADRVCAAVRREPFGKPGEKPLRLTVSVGVASFPEHGESPAMLMRTADEVLYEAKRAGRDQWQIAARPETAQAGGQIAGHRGARG